jgi:formylglycine-generating enzyme
MRRMAFVVWSTVPLVACGECNKPDTVSVVDSSTIEAVPTAVVATDSGTPSVPGMAWIPAGTLKAGTPIGRVPRISEEELPGTDFALHAFYIDLLPYPNEAGAIPTSNVTRDDAEQLCASKGKRLCSELEWERACKGDENATYEYGDVYRENVCGTGVSADESAKRPSGDRNACKSPFGVLEMHGGVWEWTSSPWGRGGAHNDLGVLRGGNAPVGELVGRCANALGRNVTHKGATMGFRCCKGDKNDAKVELKLVTGRALEPQQKGDAVRFLAVAKNAPSSAMASSKAFHTTTSWTWRPVPNEVLTIASGCADFIKGKPKDCMIVVFRDEQAGDIPLAALNVDVGVGEVALAGDARHTRFRALDTNGVLYGRAITYAYGRVDISEIK